jgi:hypothetical protein
MIHPPASFASTSHRQPDDVSRLRIILLGYIIRGPLGGFASYQLQYLLGLTRLGHDVYFVEDSDDYPSCYDPARDITDTDPTYGLAFARKTFDKTGLEDRWAYYDAHTQQWHGPCANRIFEIFTTGDLLLNIGGVNPLRPWLMDIKARALIDLDPVFTQIRNIMDPASLAEATKHTSFFSVGENIVNCESGIPKDGLPWQATRQPVVLDRWPFTIGPENGKYTTIMLWDSYPKREYKGQNYGMKSDSFGPYLDFPMKAGPIFELAVGSSTAPRDKLRSNDWLVRDSREPTQDLQAYQHYIQQSKAEFSVAKHGYVVSRSGWFSDRSAAYLASGRPVVIQETGFSDWLAAGAGVIPFNTPDEAIVGIEEVNRRYKFHCEKTLEIVSEYFDSRKILTHLIDRAMN